MNLFRGEEGRGGLIELRERRFLLSGRVCGWLISLFCIYVFRLLYTSYLYVPFIFIHILVVCSS